MPADIPTKSFATSLAWETWLEKQAADTPGVWLRIYKKDSGTKTVTYAEALDVALCHGWIDSQKAPDDADAWLQKFTPRRARSGWSKRNTEHVARLIAEKRMRPAGLAQVEAAKKDGRWSKAYESQSTSEIPEDFLAALKKDKKAFAFFETLNKVNRYAVAYRLHTAKTPETRARRMEKLLETLKKGERFH